MRWLAEMAISSRLSRTLCDWPLLLPVLSSGEYSKTQPVRLVALRLIQAQTLRFSPVANGQVRYADRPWTNPAIQTSGMDRYQGQMPGDNRHQQCAYMDWPSQGMNKRSRNRAHCAAVDANPTPRKHPQSYRASHSLAVS